MNMAFMLNDNRAIPLMMQLAYRNMKKPGQGMAEELIEVSKRHPDWVTIIGKTKMDADLMAGNMRENGVKVLNLNEIQRQKDGENNA